MPMPAEVLAVSPLSWGELASEAVSVAATAIAFRSIHKVYQVRFSGHRYATLFFPYLVALCISFIPVMALAYLFEDRQMWWPGQHSAVFFIGDGFLLPLMAVALGRMRRISRIEEPYADTREWRIIIMIIAITVSYLFHFSQFTSWPFGELHAPSKVWHDFFVYPIFIYYLGSQLPYLIQGPWKQRWRLQAVLAATVIAGFAGWYVLANVYDPSRVHDHNYVFVVASPPLR